MKLFIIYTLFLSTIVECSAVEILPKLKETNENGVQQQRLSFNDGEIEIVYQNCAGLNATNLVYNISIHAKKRGDILKISYSPGSIDPDFTFFGNGDFTVSIVNEKSKNSDSLLTNEFGEHSYIAITDNSDKGNKNIYLVLVKGNDGIYKLVRMGSVNIEKMGLEGKEFPMTTIEEVKRNK